MIGYKNAVAIRKFADAQPRVPAGSPAGGEFAPKGEATGGYTFAQRAKRPDPPAARVVTADEAWDRMASKAPPGMSGTLSPDQAAKLTAALAGKGEIFSGHVNEHSAFGRSVNQLIAARPGQAKPAVPRQGSVGYKNKEAEGKFTPRRPT